MRSAEPEKVAIKCYRMLLHLAQCYLSVGVGGALDAHPFFRLFVQSSYFLPVPLLN